MMGPSLRAFLKKRTVAVFFFLQPSRHLDCVAPNPIFAEGRQKILRPRGGCNRMRNNQLKPPPLMLAVVANNLFLSSVGRVLGGKGCRGRRPLPSVQNGFQFFIVLGFHRNSGKSIVAWSFGVHFESRLIIVAQSSSS